MNPQKLLSIMVVFFSAATAAPAVAYDWSVDAHVTIIEGDYLPNSIAFQIDSSAGSCTAGTWLNYFAQGSTSSDKQVNIQGALASLMTAFAAGKTVRLYGLNSNCSITNIWVFR